MLRDVRENHLTACRLRVKRQYLKTSRTSQEGCKGSYADTQRSGFIFHHDNRLVQCALKLLILKCFVDVHLGDLHVLLLLNGAHQTLNGSKCSSTTLNNPTGIPVEGKPLELSAFSHSVKASEAYRLDITILGVA